MTLQEILDYGYDTFDGNFLCCNFIGFFREDVFCLFRKDGKFIANCNTLTELQENEKKYCQQQIDKFTDELKSVKSRIIKSDTKKLNDAKIYVDLGLPSGTLWADRNEHAEEPNKSGIYCGWNFYEIIIPPYNPMGIDLPSKEQFEELINECKWTSVDNGYSIEGKNGAKIFLPCCGTIINVQDVYNNNGTHKEPFLKDDFGFYWSRDCTKKFPKINAYSLYFNTNDSFNGKRCQKVIEIRLENMGSEYQLRTVKNKS